MKSHRKGLLIFRFVVFLSFMFLAACTTILPAQPVRFSLPTTASGIAGAIIDIPLLLDPGNHAVGSFDVMVEFQKTLLSFVGYSNGPILAADNWFVDVNGNNVNGTAAIGAFSSARVTGSGAVVLLRFMVNTNAVGGDSTRLLLQKLAATDTNAVSLPVQGVAGTFIVKAADSGGARNEESFAFPNPFNPDIESTQILFALKKPAAAAIKILDGRGEVVREFERVVAPLANAAHLIQWDGRNSRGDWVVHGVYFYIIEAAENPRLIGKIGVVR